MRKIKNRFVVAMAIFMVLGAVNLLRNKVPRMQVGEAMVKVEIRDTEEGRNLGLSEVKFLRKNKGMLFVFSEKKKYIFWMKDMNFNLDFVWISDNKVVDITENVPKPQNNEKPISVKPKEAVNKVLEVNSGWVKENRAKIGDEVVKL